MLKKLLIASGISIASISNACAGFYLGPTLTYNSYRAGGGTRYIDASPRATAGFGTVRDYMYFAGEIFVGPKSIRIKDDSTASGSLKTSYSYGASILPGIMFDDTILGYARLGFITTHFEDANATKTGYQVGLGAQTDLTETWSIRAEYDHSVYRSISGLGTPKADQWSVGFLHHFG